MSTKLSTLQLIVIIALNDLADHADSCTHLHLHTHDNYQIFRKMVFSPPVSAVSGRGYKIGPVCVFVCSFVCLTVIQRSHGRTV